MLLALKQKMSSTATKRKLTRLILRSYCIILLQTDAKSKRRCWSSIDSSPKSDLKDHCIYFFFCVKRKIFCL